MKFTFRLAVYLFLLLTFFTQSTTAQCIYVGPEPDSVLTPDCTTQTTATYGNGVGAGAYRFYSGFSANTWYYFNLGNEPGDLTCASANFADVNKNTVGNWSNILTNTAYMLAPANTNYVWVQTAHSGGWTGTSAVLTYGVAVPATPVWSSNPANVCTNTPTVYSVNSIDYATGYVWTISGSGYFNGNSNLTTLTTNSNSVTVTFTSASSSDSISVYATNNGVCSSSTVATYFNSFVSPIATIGAEGSALCPGGSTTMDVSYNGAGTPLFQWQYFDGSS